jgi:hypothetical protein
MSSNQRNCYFFFDFHTARGFSKTKTHQKTKWVLMRLDATTLTDKKSAILNIQKKTKTRYQVKKQK